MFRFYPQADEITIQRAAENNNWDEVNKLYRTNEHKNKSTLDEAICDGVINKAAFSNLRIGQAESYLLRALTLGPVTIKPILIERLNLLPTFSELQHQSGFITKLAELSADIYTVMLVQKCDYDTALAHVNQDSPIPRVEALSSILNMLHSFKQ